MNTVENDTEKIEWSIDVPFFKNSIILKQLGIAIGIPFGLLLIFFFVISKPEDRIYTLYAFGLIFLLFFLTYLFIMFLYKGKYSVSFILDDKGIQSFTQADMAKKNKIVNGLTVGLGLLAGKPTVAGAGMLANSKQSARFEMEQNTESKIQTQTTHHFITGESYRKYWRILYTHKLSNSRSFY